MTPGFRGLFPRRIHRAEDLFKALQGQLHGVAVPELPWPLGMVGMSELTADSQVFYVQTHRYDSIRFYTILYAICIHKVYILRIHTLDHVHILVSHVTDGAGILILTSLPPEKTC